jgi:hypothetical protein
VVDTLVWEPAGMQLGDEPARPLGVLVQDPNRGAQRDTHDRFFY